MRRVLAVLVILTACGGSPPPRDEETSSSPVDYLLRSSAKDFRAHPPSPTGFRTVRFGYKAIEGTRQAVLCGEAETGAWTPFAAVRTSGYELYLGGQATAFCQGVISWEPGDLSATLLARYSQAAE